MILLDTDVSIEILRGNQVAIDNLASAGQLAVVSFMTVGELYFGALKSSRPEHNQNQVDQFLQAIHVIDSDAMIMMKFAQLKAELSKAGRPLPDADVLIAAVALMKCSKLVTGYVGHFARFPGLVVENWIK